MPFKLAALILAASCLPAMAALPSQGNVVIASGRAHVERGGQGIYIEIEKTGPGPSVAGFIPFGNDGAYPGWADLEGHRVTIWGVLAWNGRAMITMTDPDQLAVAR